LVAPLMVRSPVSLYLSLPDGSILVLLKVMVGCVSASRKLDERRSLSLVSLCVRMLSVLMLASIFECSGARRRSHPLR